MALPAPPTTTPDVIVAGLLCLDIIPAMSQPDTIKPGQLIQIGPPRFGTGGAVGNTGLALHRLGVKTRLVSCTGNDYFGAIASDLLTQSGVDHALMTRSDVSTSYSIVISPPGIDRSFLHCPGVNDVFSPDEVTDALLRGARLLHFGYPPVMRATFADGGAALARLFQRARQQGLCTSLDMCSISASGPDARVNWPAFYERVLPHVDCFVPSYDELCVTLGRDPDAPPTSDVLETLADEVLGHGCGLFVTKLGSAGLFAAASNDARKLARINPAWEKDTGLRVRQACFQVDVAGTTAAGDSTIAGLIAGILSGQSLAQAATTATAVGASCVESTDSVRGIPPLATIQQRIATGWRTRQQ
ncbi:MAG: carbohydrate kinase family protein [Phycisphaerales bacterium]|nr:carbohydrate kinase family protein [Phycisphaerales bacterium]